MTNAAPVVEYAIQLGDGTYATSYGDYQGTFVMTWTSLDEARDECLRIRNAGLTLRDGEIERDPTYCAAQVVSREVTPWAAVDRWLKTEVSA